MNKIEQIEKLLKRWKACKPPEENVHGIISIKKCKGGVIALEQALTILKEPSNLENATEADVCEWGHTAESCPDSDDCFNRCPVHNLPR